MSTPNHQKTPNNIMDKENNMGPGSPIKQNTPSMPHIPKMPCMPKMPPNSKMPMEKNGMEYQAKFMMAMEGFSATCASSIVKAFDLSQHRSAVDLGGRINCLNVVCNRSRQFPSERARLSRFNWVNPINVYIIIEKTDTNQILFDILIEVLILIKIESTFHSFANYITICQTFSSIFSYKSFHEISN